MEPQKSLDSHVRISNNNLPYFTPVFQTKEQVKHFCGYVTGLIVGDKKTIAAI